MKTGCGATAATSRTGMWHSRNARRPNNGMWEDAMQDQTTRAGSWRGRFVAGALATTLTLALPAAPAGAAEKVTLSTFQANLCCFTVYVAKQLKLFEKHGVDVELVYGTGIQAANIMISGSAESGAFAVEHGVTVSSKGQDLKLIVLEQQLPPLSLIVHNDVTTPNADKPDR